jgi:hypothetical protein
MSTDVAKRQAVVLFLDLRAAIAKRSDDVAERHRAFQRAYRGNSKAFVDGFTDIETHEGQTRWAGQMQMYLEHAK